jgi:hypothetical protein
MGALVGLYEIVKFTKITKDSTNLHDNNNTPNVSCMGMDRHSHTYLVHIQG